MDTAALRHFVVPAPKMVVIKCMGNVLYTMVQCFRPRPNIPECILVIIL